MSNDVPIGLPASIDALGRSLITMMPPLHNDKTERDKMDDILRGVDRNLSTLTERVAHIQQGMDRLTDKLDKMDGERISRQEYKELKQQNDDNRNRLNSHYTWLIILTVSILLVFGLVIYIFANGM